MAKQVAAKDPTLNQGNKLGTPKETAEFPPGPSSQGTSFGESMREPIQEAPYEPGLADRMPITTLTVEVSGTQYSGQAKDPAARAAQLQAYADALLDVFLK